MYFYNDPVFNWEMDLLERQARVVESGTKAAAPVGADVFQYAAGRRLWTQRILFDALTYRTYDVRRWITHGDTHPTFDQWLEFALIVSVVAAITIAPYLSLWTAPVAFALDAYNIYQYFS